MTKKDLGLVTIIGGAVGLLFQPIADNLISGSPFLRDLLGAASLSSLLRIAVFVGFLMFAPLALWVANFLSQFWRVLYQFAKFAAVGTLNTFINFGVLNFLSLFFGKASGPLIPVFATAAFLAATTNSFFWNKFWTFGAKGAAEAKETLEFYLVSVGGWALNVSVVSIVVNYLRPEGVSPQLWLNAGGMAGVAASFLWNFLFYKYIVFKKSDAASPASLLSGQKDTPT